MKRKGTSIIFVNDKRQILLFLRDDKPGLPYRNMWDVPGGHAEDGETPEQCIVREMQEEMGLSLNQFDRHKRVHSPQSACWSAVEIQFTGLRG